MIDLYSWTTPNGHKVHIALEELGLDYHVHPVNIGAGDQFSADFLAISPNNKIPAIVDHDGPTDEPLSLFESGAILTYLAEKTGQLIPTDTHARYAMVQWLFFQVGHVGPMLGQIHHFRNYSDTKIQYAIDRYTNEGKRLYGVMDKHLSQAAYFGGQIYSIADIAIWPWLRGHEKEGIDMAQYPHVKAWFEKIGERPGVRRGLEALREFQSNSEMAPQAKEVLFGNTQFRQR